jgi:hypothetical protein
MIRILIAAAAGALLAVAVIAASSPVFNLDPDASACPGIGPVGAC